MTCPTRRSLKRRLDALEGDTDIPDIVIVIGGDPEEGGAHAWNPDAGTYVNEHGHEIPPEDAPTGVDVVNTDTDGEAE